MAVAASLAVTGIFPKIVALGLLVGVVRGSWRCGLVVAIVVLGSWRASDATPSAPTVRAAGRLEEAVLLSTDPVPFGPGTRATARSSLGEIELVAFGSAGKSLRRRLAGERVVVLGRLERSNSATRPGQPAVRLSVTGVGDWWPGSPLMRSANRVRRTIGSGAAVLPADVRSVYLGLVMGDDRNQPRYLVDAFRASGLSHLTAVSGQNVAFVLIVVSPLLRRLPRSSRWFATIVVVGWFATLTRWEPSVIRASCMVVLSVSARWLARPVSGARLLFLSVSGLVLIDPGLARSVGFWLSASATCGLVTLGPLIRRCIPGPAVLAEAIGASASAQVGVLPVQVLVFGWPSLAGLPANLLAGPVAGAVMVWGIPAGLVGGIGPRWLAQIVHLPTHLGVSWVIKVAEVGAVLPNWIAVIAVVALVGLGWWWGVRYGRDNGLDSFGEGQ